MRGGERQTASQLNFIFYLKMYSQSLLSHLNHLQMCIQPVFIVTCGQNNLNYIRNERRVDIWDMTGHQALIVRTSYFKCCYKNVFSWPVVDFFLSRFLLPKRGSTPHGLGKNSVFRVRYRPCLRMRYVTFDNICNLTVLSSRQWLYPGITGHL